MDDGSMFSGAPTWWIVGVIAIVLIGVISGVMNWKKAADAGVNPLTMETEAMTTLIKSKALAPEKSLESRLKEVDDLLARGVISPAEHTAARAEILKG
jgi:hypothetical protein